MISQFLIANAGYKLIGGLYLGWGIGANNAANIFGTAVATNVLRYKTAIILIAIFILIGATLEGPGLFRSGSVKFVKEEVHAEEKAEAGGTTLSATTLALIATTCAALTITIITYLSIPTSTSQAAIGAFIGIAIAGSGMGAVDWSKFIKMLGCWFLHPIIGIVLCIFLLKVLGFFFFRYIRNPLTQDRIMKVGFLVFGCYGAYALGANNVVVTTASYYQAGMFNNMGLDPAVIGALLGGLSISIGALTYGKKVMMTIGKKITPLSPFPALIVVIVHAVTLHFFTQIGIPVSSSHAVVGAVIGVGLLSGTSTVNRKTLIKIFVGWITTPLIAAVAAFSIVKILG